MKRFLSIVLALALTLTFVPTPQTFAADEETVATEMVYTLDRTLVDLTDDTVWTGTEKDWSLEYLIDYGTHGYKFWTADEYTKENSKSIVYLLQFMTGGLRIYSRNPSTDQVYNNEGAKATIALEKPAAVPSFYKVKVSHHSNGDAKKPEVFLSNLNVDNKDIGYYMSEDKRVENIPDFDSTTTRTLSDIIYHNGESDLAFTFFTGIGTVNEDEKPANAQLTKITLVPATVTDITLTAEAPSCLVGETKQLKVTATLDDNSTMKVVDSFVKYESSDDDIATVAEDGTITPHKKGTVTITATVGEFSKTFSFAAGVHTYQLTNDGSFASEDWDSTLTPKNIQSTIVPLIGYGDHGYKYWDADDVSIENIGKNVRVLWLASCLRVWSYDVRTNQDFENDKGAKLALALKAPKKGFYSVTYKKGADGFDMDSLDMAMTEISAEDEAAETRVQVESFLTKKNFIRTGISENSSSHTCEKLIAVSGENNLIWAIAVDPNGKFSAASLQLSHLDVERIALAVDKETIEIGETAQADARANNKSIAHSFVTYESLNPDIAKVADDGTVTPVAPGTATIKATALDYSATTTITVNPKAPGEALADNVTLGILTNYKDAEGGVTAAGYTVNFPASVAIGTTVSATAADIDGYRFAYWKDGSRFLSSDSKITYTVARNAALTAVYDVVSESAATKTVEFWNEDKTFISSVSTEDNTVTPPADPETTGYRFIGWYLADGGEFTTETELTADITRVVAKYEPESTEYTVTVNGATQTGKYDEAITLTAPASFSYWALNNSPMSYNPNPGFLAYGSAVISSVFDEDAVAEPTVVLDKVGDAFFIAYETPEGYERVETGIIFGSSADIVVNSCYSKASAKNKGAFGQFTAKALSTEKYARGYQIFKKDGNVRVIYTAAVEA